MPEQHTLLTFSYSLEKILFEVVHPRGGPMLRPHLRGLATDVWPQIEAAFSALREWLAHGMAALDSATNDALASVGLTGLQLELKLAGFFEEADRWATGHFNRRVAQLRRLLQWANVILGSLARVYPGAEVIKEFKEVVEAGVDFTGAPAIR